MRLLWQMWMLPWLLIALMLSCVIYALLAVAYFDLRASKRFWRDVVA